MLQSLLEDRFGLQLHHETKDFKAYNLVEAKGGLKLKDAVSTDLCAAGVGRPVNGSCPTGVKPIFGIARSAPGEPQRLASSPKEGGFVVIGQSSTLSSLARMLEVRLQGTLLVDKTGLTENYDFLFEFASLDVGAQGDFALPSLFTVLEKELGLKLEPATVSLDTLVIDHIAAPAEN